MEPPDRVICPASNIITFDTVARQKQNIKHEK